MANEEHLAILKQGVEAWNQWRRENPLIRPDLIEADLSGANLREADLRNANLYTANLREADLYTANLREADLSGASLRRADLRGANLIGADLSGASLRRADLRGANLIGAHLVRANLRQANLIGADLYGADLREADLREADFSGADLYGADLREAILSGVDLCGANLEGALVGRSMFDDIDLSVVKGLDRIRHLEPSTVGIDTIYRSKGKIPEVFLRGCGVPDQMIASIVSLAGQPETNRAWLRMMIDKHFNKSELQTLCFDMDVDYDGLNGENKSDKARELVAYCQRRGTIRDLVAKCRELRPNTLWEGEYE